MFNEIELGKNRATIICGKSDDEIRYAKEVLRRGLADLILEKAMEEGKLIIIVGDFEVEDYQMFTESVYPGDFGVEISIPFTLYTVKDA